MDNGAECVPVSLDDVLITPELRRRVSRAPAHEAENRAMRKLIEQMGIALADVLQTVADLAMSLCAANSAAISVLESNGEEKSFRWLAVTAGPNGMLPEISGSCGEVVARGEVALLDRPDRICSEFRSVEPRIYEALLAPWKFEGKFAGALWVFAHSPERKFDAEDARLVETLAQFASASYGMMESLRREKLLQSGLEEKVEERTQALSEAFEVLRRGTADRIIAEAERSVAEQALLESEKLAAVGRLASSIAHEINNPLEAITNLLYLAEGAAVDPKAQQYIEQAQVELARVTRIATETLRFHRQSTNAAFADLAEIIESVTWLHEVRLRQEGIEIERRFKPHRPLLCFPSEVRQVIANLISNAGDAMRGVSGARLLLCIREARHCKTGQPGVRITVADTGTGMDSATRKRAFEAFFTTKEATGTGLGLWVCSEIVHKHNGDLRVHSSRAQAHHGTVFTVFLPYPESAAERKQPPQPEREHPQSHATPRAAHS